MPPVAIKVVEWAVGLILNRLATSDSAKKGLANILIAADLAVQAVDARTTGPFKGVLDEVAAAFSSSVKSINAALLSDGSCVVAKK